jgi:exosortase
MRSLFFPWLFLAFMWPMFPIEERVVGKLRLITAALSGEVLHLIGIDVVREGTALSSTADPARGLSQGAVFQLDVEEPCSGVRSLYSLLMVSALYGYLSLKRTFPRLVLFASAIPLAMAGNVVRMVLLALGSMWFGTEFAVGRNLGDGHQEMSVYHSLCGYAVFAVALVGMFGLCSLLEGKHWKSLKNLKKRISAKASGPAAATLDSPRRIVIMSAASVAIALAGIGICAGTNVNPTIADPGVVMKLPLQFGKYQGSPHDMTAMERNILDPGVELVRSQYISSDQRMVVATVIQSGIGKRTLHRPEVCLPGQGWNITDRTLIPMKLANGTTIQAMMLRMFRDFEPSPGQRRRMRALNIYWYIGSDGTTSPDYYDHIRIGYIDAVFKNLSHRWAMASFFLPMPDTDVGLGDPMGEVTALEELREFAGSMSAEFMKSGGK